MVEPKDILIHRYVDKHDRVTSLDKELKVIDDLINPKHPLKLIISPNMFGMNLHETNGKEKFVMLIMVAKIIIY